MIYDLIYACVVENIYTCVVENIYGNNPLSTTCREIIMALIKYESNVNCKNKKKYTTNC